MGEIEKLGATLVALTPQLPEYNRELRSKHTLAYHLLTDKGNDYAAKLGLRFVLPTDLQEAYKAFGNDLAVKNGEPSWTLAVPGRFVVDKSGIIRAADVDVDYRYRPEPEKTLEDLRALG